jgi:hypothetical protein
MVLCVYLTLISLQLALSKPLQAPNVTGIRVVNNARAEIGSTTKIDTKVKSFAISNSGAFNPINSIGFHATAHKTIKKKSEGKKKIKKTSSTKSPPSTSMPIFCILAAGPTKGNDNANVKTRPNTIFTSHNWGNAK